MKTIEKKYTPISTLWHPPSLRGKYVLILYKPLKETKCYPVIQLELIAACAPTPTKLVIFMHYVWLYINKYP